MFLALNENTLVFGIFGSLRDTYHIVLLTSSQIESDIIPEPYNVCIIRIQEYFDGLIFKAFTKVRHLFYWVLILTEDKKYGNNQRTLME